MLHAPRHLEVVFGDEGLVLESLQEQADPDAANGDGRTCRLPMPLLCALPG